MNSKKAKRYRKFAAAMSKTAQFETKDNYVPISGTERKKIVGFDKVNTEAGSTEFNPIVVDSMSFELGPCQKGIYKASKKGKFTQFMEQHLNDKKDSNSTE